MLASMLINYNVIYIYISIIYIQYIYIYCYMAIFYHMFWVKRIIWTIVQGFPLKSTFLHKQTGCDFAVWMSFIRWGYFSWMMKWHQTSKFGMQLSAAVLIAAHGSMLSISLKKFLVLSYDVKKKHIPKSIGFRWIWWYDEHLSKYLSLVFWTSIFVGLKVPFVWGTFKDMYLHTTLPIDDDDEWMKEWTNE